MLSTNLAQRRRVDDNLPKDLVERFKRALINWIVTYQIAFLVVENEFFLDLLDILSPMLAKLIPTGNIIRKWIIERYEQKKEVLKAELRDNSLSMVHLSFDLWTSINSLAMMAVISHYTDRDYKIQTRLLALRRLHGEHSGENQASLLVEIIREFDLTDKKATSSPIMRKTTHMR